MKMLDHGQVLSLLPDRRVDAHKGDFGRILLLCGSVGCTGAVWFSAMGALRTGAGVVYLGVPESIYAITATKLNEPVILPFPEEDGMFCADAWMGILPMLPRMDAVLIGPGLGQSAHTQMLVQMVLESFPGPVVLDADGINVLSGHMDIVRGREGVTILTPHEAEFLRIGGKLQGDRTENAMAFARENGCVLLLKGHETRITDGVECYVNKTGNPGMATGGSGDLLAGMIVSLLGQGIAPLQAAAVGAWLHGAAGDAAAEKLGQYAMLPSDMVTELPRLMK